MPTNDDKDLSETAAVERSRGGDLAAYGWLFERVQQRAKLDALRLLREPGDAEDAVQQAHLQAMQHLHQLDVNRPFYPWFRAIVRNIALKRIALRQRSDNRQDQATDQSARSDVRSSAETLALRQALQRLRRDEQEILILKHVEGRSYEEIAARLDIARGTVMSRLHTARLKLRTLLEEE